MEILEAWVRSLLEQPVELLDRKYAEQYSAVQDIEAWPYFSRYRAGCRRVSTQALEELATKIRGLGCEEEIWKGPLWFLTHPLPSAVVHDLIDRDVAVEMLGHSRQVDEVQWRLADLVDEALLTLAKEFYIHADRSLEELQGLLSKYPDHVWMLDSLAHCCASSPEKRDAFVAVASRRPDAERLLLIRASHTDTPVDLWLKRWTLAQPPTVEQLLSLYGTRDSEAIHALACDSGTPTDILEELTQIKGIPLARQIRQAADRNLRQRQEENAND